MGKFIVGLWRVFFVLITLAVGWGGLIWAFSQTGGGMSAGGYGFEVAGRF